MVAKKQLNVRIPADLYEKMESSEKTQVAIIEEALRKYFDSDKVVDATKKIEELQKEVIQLTERISSKDNEIRVMNEGLGRAYDHAREWREAFNSINDKVKSLLPSPEEITKKAWWHFWKK